MWKLVIQDDEGKTTVVPLIRDEITIGRKEGNTIRLTERNVSRRHARIHRANGAVTIEDLNSYNGVIVNGTRVQGKSSLAESDRVQIGDYLIELKSDRTEAASDAPEDTGPETQPMERVDPMGNTPVPLAVHATDTGAATVPVSVPVPVPVRSSSPTALTAKSVREPVASTPPPAGAVEPGAAPAPGPKQPALRHSVEAKPGVAVGASRTPASLADTDPGSRPEPQLHARLVVLSSNFAGEEFTLSRPASVIGRTDDNDIVVNHRSISRHHAKVVHEDERFWIVDLGSSNGVRVNGEEYGKVELRRADVVDLGHVRLRFVEAGEEFLLGRDAQIVDLAAESAGAGRGFVLGLLALLVIGGAVAAFALTRDAETPTVRPGPAPTGATSSAGVVPPGPADTPPDDGPGVAMDDPDAVAPAAAAPPATIADRLELARAARDEERWADMQGASIEALSIDPANTAARQLQAQAERELANQLRYGNFRSAVSARDYGKVHAIFKAMDATSVYRLRAQLEHDKAMSEFTDSVRVKAESLADKDKCRDLRALASRTRAIYAEAADVAQRYATSCQASQPDPVSPGRRDEPFDPSPAEPQKSVVELVEEAKTAAKTGNYGQAYRLCEAALALRPTELEARTVCVIAACNMGNDKRAMRHYVRLPTNEQRKVYQVCAIKGIRLE